MKKKVDNNRKNGALTNRNVSTLNKFSGKLSRHIWKEMKITIHQASDKTLGKNVLEPWKKWIT